MLRGILTASVLASATVLVAQVPAQATDDERVVVIDAPDVQKLDPGRVPGFRTGEVIGTDVYSNAGSRIGEIEDFIVSSSGHLYAVIDFQDSGFERYVDITNDEVVVVPWDQLRVSTEDMQAAR